MVFNENNPSKNIFYHEESIDLLNTTLKILLNFLFLFLYDLFIMTLFNIVK